MRLAAMRTETERVIGQVCRGWLSQLRNLRLGARTSSQLKPPELKFVLKVTMEGNKKGTWESGSAASAAQVGATRCGE